MSHVTSIGLDVHARSVAACAFNLYTGEAARRSFGADAGEIAAWIKGFEDPKAVYESGPTGFALCRELRALGVDCVVGAVSKMQRPAADRRRKNDRRDAAFLARLLAARNVVEVWVPPLEAESARDLSRALDDAREDLRRARQRLSKFLLRRGHAFDEVDALGRRKGAWTRAFWRWAEGLRPNDAAAASAFDHYAACVRCAESDKRALERRVLSEARSDRWRAVVGALSCIKGIDAVTAFCLATEAGCFSRFATAGAYASWLGLTPSEHSSGEREARGGITKTGNAASRRALVEAAWHYASCSPRPKAAPAGYEVAPQVKGRADDATARLARRHGALRAAGKRPCVANVAVARELACWVWEIGRRAEGTLG
ncbi:IS110 family RNA-guided transposase [Candidatus Collinsella stercoripullorum]|uniref:IS110 family transposase n=1 Tax=Candidatus Collinsella stercoripullorum TaxID=2838522 RepID=UPI0022E1CE45|nr:IS110 family transposase [Candidatus Collinsella stercoripullorum]